MYCMVKNLHIKVGIKNTLASVTMLACHMYRLGDAISKHKQLDKRRCHLPNQDVMKLKVWSIFKHKHQSYFISYTTQ